MTPAYAQIDADVFALDVDALSDVQIKQLLFKAREAGYTEQDLYLLARSRGVSESEVLKLSERIADLDKQKIDVVRETPIQENDPPPATNEPIDEGLPYFGYDLFSSAGNELFFASIENTAPPSDYVLGPTDYIVINVYGESEKSYAEIINSSGFVMLRNVGPVYLSGLTMRKAQDRVKVSLGTVYKDLVAADPKTFVQLSLAQVRTINVNLVGALKKPGSYTISGLSTVYNAIYAAGGPTVEGTLREVKVLRKNKLIATLDYYDFLLNGLTDNNVRLDNDDVIIVGPHINRVTINGAVKRPGIYEMKDGETFDDLLKYTGGFNAYAYKERISVTRNGAKEKLVSDILIEQFKLFEVKAGDEYEIGEVLNRYENRVTINGSVYRPGNYAISEGLTLKSLVERAEGLTGDAFLGRATLRRQRENLKYDLISIDLGGVMSGAIEDIPLEREDEITVLSIHNLDTEKFVRISGEVKQPGVHPYSDQMTLNDLVFLASGFRESASTGTIEIARRPARQSVDNLSKIFTVGIDSALNISDNEIELMPFDHVIVRRNPNFFREKSVQIFGEVNFPGTYVLASEGERVSSLIQRAGGKRKLAYLEGATLLRKTEFYVKGGDESADSELDFIYDDFVQDENVELTTRAKQERLKQLAKNNPFLEGIEIEEVESIALNMDAILLKPGSSADLVLEEGDIINIPKELTTLRLRGRVLYPNTVRFVDGKGLKYYIGKAGGFGTRALKKRTYVVYANGEVSRTRGFMFFRQYPVPEPGAEVIVPVKPLKVPIKPSEFIGITSGLATIALLITQIVQ
ncbi:MAG: SLBB domain-containing protein [Cytophagales bacterium]|nr:SLBB domain-containing protein [Cytophagales bacterium]